MENENLQEISPEVLENEEVLSPDVSDTEHIDLPDSGDSFLIDEEMAADPDEEQSCSDSLVDNSETERTFTQDELEQIVNSVMENQRDEISSYFSRSQVFDLDKRNLYNSDKYVDSSVKFEISITGLDPEATYIFSCNVSSDFAYVDEYKYEWVFMTCLSDTKYSGVHLRALSQSAGNTFTFEFTGKDTFKVRSIPSYFTGSTSNYLLYDKNYGIPVEVVEGTLFTTPLVEYSVSEGLLVCIFFLLLAQFIHSIFKGSHWFGKL